MPNIHKVVFLDRDGTLNAEKDYVFRPEDFEFIPGSTEALVLLRSHGFKIIVVSNQSGVARGYYTCNDIRRLEEFIVESLQNRQTGIDAFYYCPHHPEGIVHPYNIVCGCRKPGIGLYEQAALSFPADPEHSWMVGDALSDLQFGVNAGLKTILVRTGHGLETEKKIREASVKIDAIVDDFYAAALYITRVDQIKP